MKGTAAHLQRFLGHLLARNAALPLRVAVPAPRLFFCESPSQRALEFINSGDLIAAENEASWLSMILPLGP